MVVPLIIELLVLIVIPVLLIYFKVIPYKHRFKTMAAVVALMVGFIIYEGWSLERLGIRFDNILTALPEYLIYLVAGTIFIVLLARHYGAKPQKGWWKDSHFKYFFLIASFFQELVFRGFFIVELQDFISSPVLVVLFNAAIFTFIHIIYSVNPQVLFGTFLSGILFALIYITAPNLILITLTHAIFNFLVVMYGVFTKEHDADEDVVASDA
ncbi:MAG: CPBP family intramembrane glutamic endopeptidase [Nanobdellota archaeon]